MIHPPPLFRVFAPAPARTEAFAKRAMEEYLWVSDEHRNPQDIAGITVDLFYGAGNLVYEIGDDAGLIAFTDIVKGHRCGMVLKLWDPQCFGARGIRQARELINAVMDEYGLKRINTETADDRMSRLAKIAGFEEEGCRWEDFRWGGHDYDRIYLGLYRCSADEPDETEGVKEEK